MRIPLSASVLISLLLAGTALAETPEEAKRREAREELEAAISACDKGAAMPLDPTAKAAPAQFLELFPADFILDPLQKLARRCEEAARGAPDEERLRLQWIRTEVALGKADPAPFVPDIRRYAARGSAEANHLLFQVFSQTFYKTRGDTSAVGIDRVEAMAALETAADAGHQEALWTLVTQYRSGPFVRRDPAKVVEIARALMALPRQGREKGATEDEARDFGRRMLVRTILETGGFSPEEEKEAFALFETFEPKDDAGNILLRATALRHGRGTGKDPDEARRLLETAWSDGKTTVGAALAEMLVEGEGGPADPKRALATLGDERLKHNSEAVRLLAELLLDNRFVGRQPRRAAELLAASYRLDDAIRVAALLPDYHVPVASPASIVEPLKWAADVGEPGAGMALARLQLSDNHDFRDEQAGLSLLQKMADGGDAEAGYLFLANLFTNLDSSSGGVTMRVPGLSEETVRERIERGIADGRADMRRLKGQLLRRGALYPQDDRAATKEIVAAAEAGDLEAMVLAGEAYDDGLGVPEDAAERLRWWRAAAKAGSLDAREEIADAFTFDTFHKLMTLREGITEKIALYNDGIGVSFSGMGNDEFAATAEFAGTFSNSRVMEAGWAATAAAVMDGFRLAPAGLEERRLVALMKAFPDELRLEIEKALAAEGFLKEPPEGYFGPAVRDGFRAWVEAKGPFHDEEPAAPPPTAITPEAADALSSEVVIRIRDQAFEAASTAKSDEEVLAVIKTIDLVAATGDLASRWVLMRNYHQSAAIRSVVTPEEITRYNLDILVQRPQGMEKIDFEFIFNVSKMFEEGSLPRFGKTLLAQMRDEPRLQDPLILGAIAGQILFAPGGCDAVAAAGAEVGVETGGDGCGEAARTALIAWAKAAGPAGVEKEARETATAEIAKIAAAGP